MKTKPKWALFLLTLIYVINFIDRQLIAVLAPSIKNTFSLSNTEIGLLYGATFSFFYALFGIPMGHLADRLSRKFLLLFSLLIWSLATFFSGLVSGVLQLIGLRVVLAIFESAASPVSYSLITHLFPRNEWGARISLYASGIFVGIGFSFLLGGSMSEWFSWQESFQVAGVVGVIVALIAFWTIPNLPHPIKQEIEKSQNPPFFTSVVKILKIPAVIWHLGGFALLALSGYALLGFLSSHLQALGRPDLIKHYGWFMFGVAFMITLSGKLADYFAKKSTANRFLLGIAAAWVGLPLYWIGLSVTDGVWALLFIGTGALFASSYNGIAAAILQDLVPDDARGLAGGMYLFIISIGGFGLGPFLTGFLADTLFSGDFAIASALKIVMITCGLVGGFLLWKSKLIMQKSLKEQHGLK